MKKKPFRIILADDNKMFMCALKFYLESKGEFIVIGIVKSEKELIKILENAKCDIILIDNNVEEMNGISTIKKILEKFPEIHIISLTKSCDQKNFIEAIKAGVKCCISKNNNLNELENIIRTIQEGRCFIEQENMVNIQDNLKGKSNDIKLTEEEIKMLKYISDGLSNEEIADNFRRGIRTIEDLKSNLIKKLGAKNSANLVKIGIKYGLIKL